jgi:hypothetical protein
MVSFLAETARDAVYRENHDIFSGYKYLATLDTRTCLVCAHDDGKLFKNLDEAPKLPRHLNDRCLYVPYLKGFEDIPGERAAVNGPVSDTLTYQDWFAQQSERMQREILGPARYAAYKAGVPITSFVSDGRTLTLAELQQKEGLPFYKTLTEKQREALQEQSNTVYRSLTNAQRASLHDYTTFFHHQINGALYDVEPMDISIKKRIDDIEASMDKFSISCNMALFSGTNREHYKDWKVGEIYKINGYISTSVTQKIADKFLKRIENEGKSPLMLEIRVPKGSRGLYIGDNTGFHSPQYEFLLGRGQQYKVIDNADNLIILEVIK